MGKIYKGQGGILAGPAVVTVNGDPLPPRNDLRDHSPDGFQWGYGGSGPAQLALAILADHFGSQEYGDQTAQLFYQKFKWSVIAELPSGKAWTLTTEDIEGWFGKHRDLLE